MTVVIVGDTSRLLEPQDTDLLVATPIDYVMVVQRIKAAIATDQPLRVIVSNPACAVWLERFAGSYNDTAVCYGTQTARDLLAERWQTRLSDYVTDQAILDSGFLESEIEPRAGQAYDDIVLENYWGEFFTFARFPLRLAGDLINGLQPLRWQANRNRRLAIQALHQRKAQWLLQATRRELRELIEEIFERPQVIRDLLGRYKLVRNYPAKIGQAVLGEWFTRFRSLDIDPTPLDLAGLDLAGTVQEIKYYLTGLSDSISSKAELMAAVSEMSGFLLEELNWIINQVRSKPNELQLTGSDIQAIVFRFQPIASDAETQLEALAQSIPPAYPADPSKNKTADDWLNWAVDEYLPYRYWLEENDLWDTGMAKYASVYADWFYDNYIVLKYEKQDRWVFDLLNHARISLASNQKVLFIVVDNFNYKHLRFLLDQFGRRGFRVVGDVRPVWSMVPTATEVSKWCMVAGEAELKDVKGRDYEDILDKDWRGYFEGYQVAYTSVLDDIRKRSHFDEDLLLLNYLPIDETLHKDERQVAASHATQIRTDLQHLVNAVTQFAKRTHVERKLVIFIASDHGSTKYPAGVLNGLDDKFYQKRATSRHHRYISVPQKRAAEPTDYDKNECYIVRTDQFGTREDYFIARGYSRFIETKESVYVHGGLTPEETIVPFCHLVRTEIVAKQLTIYLPDNIIRYSVRSDIVFVIGNPNDYKLASLELTVTESDLPGVVIESVPAGAPIEVTVPVRIRRRPGIPVLEDITMQGSFLIEDQRFTLETVKIPVQARSLQESKSDLDFSEFGF